MHNRFFDTDPIDWRQLEDMVAQSFTEMGYDSQRSYCLETVRGRVEVDVHAVNLGTSIPTTVLCECKHWNKPVSQSVVQGFRSVCVDSGAHLGVIISKKGFQKGAENSRLATNVHLLDFAAFQDTFFEEWKRGIFIMFAKMYGQLLPILRAYFGEQENGLDILGAKAMDGVDPFRKYAIFFGGFGRYSDYFIGNMAFPIEVTDPRGSPLEIGVITIRSHREYLDIALKSVTDSTNHFGLPRLFF